MHAQAHTWLISIVGPTGVGKTKLSLDLAAHFDTVILSADVRQMYRGMDIGTAKVSAEERAAVPHFFIDTLTPDMPYSAGQFERDAVRLLGELFVQHKVVLSAGGSTLYNDALWHGIDEMPDVPPQIRQAVQQQLQQEGLAPLLQELAQADPETYARMDRNNPARVLRAVEVWRASGRPISAFRTGSPAARPWRQLKIGVTAPREELYARIDARVHAMIEAGLEAETCALLAQHSPDCQALQSIGYQEMIAYLRGEISLETAITLIQRDSRRYAKRQLTWWRRDPEIMWIEAGETATDKALQWIQQQQLRNAEA